MFACFLSFITSFGIITLRLFTILIDWMEFCFPRSSVHHGTWLDGWMVYGMGSIWVEYVGNEMVAFRLSNVTHAVTDAKGFNLLIVVVYFMYAVKVIVRIWCTWSYGFDLLYTYLHWVNEDGWIGLVHSIYGWQIGTTRTYNVNLSHFLCGYMTITIANIYFVGILSRWNRITI